MASMVIYISHRILVLNAQQSRHFQLEATRMCIVLLCVRASVSKMRALQMRAPVAFILFWLSRRVYSEFASRCIRYKLV